MKYFDKFFGFSIGLLCSIFDHIVVWSLFLFGFAQLFIWNSIQHDSLVSVVGFFAFIAVYEINKYRALLNNNKLHDWQVSYCFDEDGKEIVGTDFTYVKEYYLFMMLAGSLFGIFCLVSSVYPVCYTGILFPFVVFLMLAQSLMLIKQRVLHVTGSYSDSDDSGFIREEIKDKQKPNKKSIKINKGTKMDKLCA